MKQRQKFFVRLALGLSLLAVVLVGGYFVLFHNADVLKVQDGKVSGAKSTWLIGRFSVGDGAPQYYNLADVTAPKGYAAVRNAPDTDNDDVTTFFAYAGKKQAEHPETIVVDVAPAALSALRKGAANAVDAPEGDAFYTCEGAEAGAVLTYYLSSPYSEACVRITVSTAEAADAETLLTAAEEMRAKVSPGKQLSPLVADFKLNFLDDARWTYLTNGLVTTLEITFFAVLIGIAIGVVIASIRSTWDKNQETMRRGLGRTVLLALNKIAKFYLTVIRGTPVMIQLLIAYYVIFVSSRNGVLIAILSFGINSGAYVAEIIRSGIQSIDNGQFEAGRSLGFNYLQTMGYIVIPQALKNVLPALANEFIVLLKETSVAGYVAVRDLTKGGDIIRGATYSAFMPLIAVALIYLIMVMFFTWLVGKLERRLRSSEH